MTRPKIDEALWNGGKRIARLPAAIRQEMQHQLSRRHKPSGNAPCPDCPRWTRAVAPRRPLRAARAVVYYPGDPRYALG